MSQVDRVVSVHASRRSSSTGLVCLLVLLLAFDLIACSADPPPPPASLRQASTGGGVQAGHVAFALHSMWIRQKAAVTGKVGVRDQNAGPYVGGTAELTIAQAAQVSGDVRADSVRLEAKATVIGDAHHNSLSLGSKATITGSIITPLSLPLPDLTPTMPSFAAGSQNVTVASKTTLVLAAGAYGRVALQHGTPGSPRSPTVLELSGGTYYLQSLDLAQRSRLVCSAACEVRINERLSVKQQALIGPKTGSGLSAGDLTILVAGQNGATGVLTAVPVAVELAQSSEVRAHIVAPNGTLQVGQQSVVKGVLVGKWIDLGQHATVTVEDPLDPVAADGGIDGQGDAGAKDAGAPDAPATDASASDATRPDTCIATTCVAENAECGSIADGCGGTLSCGSCSGPETCGGGGVPNVCGCTPTTCAAEGADCGSIADDCGGTLSCGTCTAPLTCGGGGTPNVCGCTPTTCAAAGATCGSVPDGCGGTLSCGVCVAPLTCGGGGVSNVCGCTPTTCLLAGADCGSIADGCGGSLDCGVCTSPDTCGGGGTPNLCGCTPLASCAAAGAECGSVSDGCGGTLPCGSCPSGQVCGWGGQANTCGTIPPDPATVAPPVSGTEASTVYRTTSFLYSGTNPIQAGVTQGAIEPRRAAVIRGKVLDVQGSPMSGVTIAILDHPELGSTQSRSDGMFDLAVNGGDTLVVTYIRTGYLPVQRQAAVAWQSYFVVSDVVMTALDGQATTVSSMSTAMQVARGSVVSDTDGARQATILTTVAGNGLYASGADGVPATTTSLAHPYDVAVDAQGNLFIADSPSFRVRKVDIGGTITTVAGNGTAGGVKTRGPLPQQPVGPPALAGPHGNAQECYTLSQTAHQGARP